MRENKAMIFEETTAEGLLKQKLGYWLDLRAPSVKIAAHMTLSEYSCTLFLQCRTRVSANFR